MERQIGHNGFTKQLNLATVLNSPCSSGNPLFPLGGCEEPWHRTALLCCFVFGGSKTPELPEWSLHTEGKVRWKKDAGHSRLVSVSFNKQRNLLMNLLLDSWKTSESLHSPVRIFKVYTGTKAYTEFSQLYHPDDISNILFSQGCILELAPAMEMVGEIYIPRTGEGRGAFNCLCPALESTGCDVLSLTSSNSLEDRKRVKVSPLHIN